MNNSFTWNLFGYLVGIFSDGSTHILSRSLFVCSTKKSFLDILGNLLWQALPHFMDVIIDIDAQNRRRVEILLYFLSENPRNRSEFVGN